MGCDQPTAQYEVQCSAALPEHMVDNMVFWQDPRIEQRQIDEGMALDKTHVALGELGFAHSAALSQASTFSPTVAGGFGGSKLHGPRHVLPMRVSFAVGLSPCNPYGRLVRDYNNACSGMVHALTAGGLPPRVPANAPGGSDCDPVKGAGTDRGIDGAFSSACIPGSDRPHGLRGVFA